MKKITLTLFLFIAGLSGAFAQNVELGKGSGSAECFCERQPVNSRWSFLVGEAKFTNHYLNLQEYSGGITGFSAEHGRFYLNSENLSWKLTLSHLRNMHRNTGAGGLENAAKTSYISTQVYDVDYAVFYNWNICDRLQLKAGGSFNLFGDIIFGDNHAVNNVIGVDIQAQFYAAAGLRYGWDLGKIGLDIYGNISFPFMGFMTVDERYESLLTSILPGEFRFKEHSHVKFSSFHNLQGVNGELGLDFLLKRFSLFMAVDVKNRWWNAYDLQNYRKMTTFKLGVSVDLVSRQNYKSSKCRF